MKIVRKSYVDMGGRVARMRTFARRYSVLVRSVLAAVFATTFAAIGLQGIF